MHTVELLEEALRAARSLGYRIRQEWLGGEGGACEIRGQRCLFLDLGMTPGEQLQIVNEALSGEPRTATLKMSDELSRCLQRRRSA